MKSSTSNPWEQLFRAMGETFARQAKEAFIGTVTSVSASGIGLSIDGDNTGTKKYTCSRSERFSSGDRVLVVRESGTYVVVCRIGAPGGPTEKTNAMTQAVGADASGALWTEPSTLEVATASRLGGVKPITKTNAMTQDVGVDSAGGLWTVPIPTASTLTLGGVKTSEVYSSSKHKLKVAVDSSGVLYAEEPSSYNLPTASTTDIGGIKTSEAYSSLKHTRKVAVNSSGVLYVDDTMPTASTLDFGVVKTSETYSSSKHTRKIAVNSSGLLYAEAGDVPTASTSVLGGVKTSASYSSSKHTMEIAVNSSGVLYAEKQDAANVSKLYAGTSTTNYLELDANKALKPNGNNFTLGTSSYPFAEAYFGKYGSGNQFLKAEKGSIIPNTTYNVSGYFDLGSLSYPFNRVYVKELYINGTKFTPS